MTSRVSLPAFVCSCNEYRRWLCGKTLFNFISKHGTASAPAPGCTLPCATVPLQHPFSGANRGDGQGSRVLLLSRPASPFISMLKGLQVEIPPWNCVDYCRGEMEARITSTPKRLAELRGTASCLSLESASPGDRSSHGCLTASQTAFAGSHKPGKGELGPGCPLQLTACRAHSTACFSFFFSIWLFLHGNISGQEPCSSTLINILLGEEPRATAANRALRHHWYTQGSSLLLPNRLRPSTASDTTATAQTGPYSDFSSLQQLLSASTAST